MRKSIIAAAAVAVCVAILSVDAIVAARRDTKDDKKVTAARLARRSRDNAVSWALIASAALFLFVVKKSPVVQKSRTYSKRYRAATARERTQPPSLDLTVVDQLVHQHGRTKESAILLLQAIQSHYRYLPDEALRRLCELTDITPAQLTGASSFYNHFRRTPTGKHVVRVCHGTACHVAGATQITEELRRHLGIPEGNDTDPSQEFTIDEVACLGCCSLAPVLMVDGHTKGRLTPHTASEAL